MAFTKSDTRNAHNGKDDQLGGGAALANERLPFAGRFRFRSTARWGKIPTRETRRDAWNHPMYSDEQRQQVLAAARGLRDTVERHMFGCWCLFAFGRMVAVVMNDDVIVRLDPNSRRRALALPGAAPFTPRPGMTARELVKLPPGAVRSRTRLASWLRVAHAYAAATAKPPSPRQGKKRKTR